jgi:hypothetical protein
MAGARWCLTNSGYLGIFLASMRSKRGFVSVSIFWLSRKLSLSFLKRDSKFLMIRLMILARMVLYWSFFSSVFLLVACEFELVLLEVRAKTFLASWRGKMKESKTKAKYSVKSGPIFSNKLKTILESINFL